MSTCRRTGRWYAGPIAFAVLLPLFAACGQPYGVRATDDERYFRTVQTSALNSGHESAATQQFLRRQFPEDAPRMSREEAIRRLIALHAERPSQTTAFALAELCYREGKRRGSATAEAAKNYLTSAVFAYAYLFEPGLEGARSPFDRRYRMACDLYNRSLSRVVAGRRPRPEDWGHAKTLETLIGPVRVAEFEWQLPLPPGQYDTLQVAYRYEVRGLENHSRQEGLGVPLILTRAERPTAEPIAFDEFLPRMGQQAFPATLVAQFRGSTAEAARTGQGLTAGVGIIDTVGNWQMHVGGRGIPLEADYTTPLAYMIEQAPHVSGFEGFMNVPAWEDRRGLYMMHPYQPSKIPVVFVYGLMGKPMTWVPMVNELMDDETLRSHYQFWYFAYPTGNPVLYSAAVLREELKRARQVLDPEGDDAPFERMVIVGHSMGGLVSRLQVTSSGDTLWRTIVDRPLDSLTMDEKMREMLRSVMFFDALPFIERAVFMATPHRGSELADTNLAQVIGGEITLPEVVVQAVAALKAAEGSTGVIGEEEPTAVVSLSAKQPMLKALDRLPIAPHVTYHSVICNHEAADTPGGTDTIVPYASSHLEGAASEKIIHSKHSCTRNPAAIHEVKRILLHHLATVEEPVIRR